MLQGFDLRADRRTGVKITALPVYIDIHTYIDRHTDVRNITALQTSEASQHFLCIYIFTHIDRHTDVRNIGFPSGNEYERGLEDEDRSRQSICVCGRVYWRVTACAGASVCVSICLYVPYHCVLFYLNSMYPSMLLLLHSGRTT
jgi:hypothetical protein